MLITAGFVEDVSAKQGELALLGNSMGISSDTLSEFSAKYSGALDVRKSLAHPKLSGDNNSDEKK